MTKLSRQNIGGIDYTMVGCTLTGVCASAASDYVKTVVLSDGDILADGMTVAVTFANGNTAGTAPASLTIYSSDQVNYYSDSGLTQPFTLAPAGCYEIEYTGTGNAYTYISYPVVQIAGVTAPVCNSRGKKTSGAAWDAGDTVLILYSGSKFMIVSSLTNVVAAGSKEAVTSDAVYNAIDKINYSTAARDIATLYPSENGKSEVFGGNFSGNVPEPRATAILRTFRISAANTSEVHIYQEWEAYGASSPYNPNIYFRFGYFEGSDSPTWTDWERLVKASEIRASNNDDYLVDITNTVTKYLGAGSTFIRKANNMVYLLINGTYTGGPSTATQLLIEDIPVKYRPRMVIEGFVLLGYNSNQYVTVARGRITTDGKLYLQETSWDTNTAIRCGVIYFLN